MIYEILGTEQFWVLVAFIVFVGLVFNPIKKILQKSLDSKIQDIKNSINDAEKLKNDAQKTLSEIKKRQNEVTKEIELIKEEVAEKIKLNEEDANSKLKEQIAKHNNLNSMKIEQLTREANNEIQKYLLELSLATVEDILIKKLQNKEKQDLIDKSIDEIKVALKN
tara:strand:+ start:768 stop:1265 length:498 start_codon:yes stop_codon:yes gene_type:complete